MIERIRRDESDMDRLGEHLAADLATVEHRVRRESVKQVGLPRGERFGSDIHDRDRSELGGRYPANLR